MSRVAPPSAPGSLLKGVTPTKKARKEKLGRSPRVRDDEHLEAVRQLPCLSCGLDAGCEAAHIRLSRGKGTGGGIGLKPSDSYVTPLCSACHRQQHSDSEVGFWDNIGIDPHTVAASLYRMSPSVEAMRAIIFTARAINMLEKK